jgi:hypothetical protein
MKKNWLLLFSILIAFGIAFYSKRPTDILNEKSNLTWSTYVKNSNMEVLVHHATPVDLKDARVPMPNREIAAVNDEALQDDTNNLPEQKSIISNNHFLLRNDRVLIGNFHIKNYEDENTPLEMMNKINPKWKNILGHELLRFQNNGTKVLIKEEFSIIQIKEDKGRYVEQVIITYVLKNGSVNSYRALIDSDTGSIVETWDKTIHERPNNNKLILTPSSENNSDVSAR